MKWSKSRIQEQREKSNDDKSKSFENEPLSSSGGKKNNAKSLQEVD